ncbi:MAG TPA: CPBP family intramembrane metalloprotease [Bryobacteraceae bacterium]|nr:CPBP family intramembrane metalloprotease [Bryobacteraceae bacterium]HOQ45378.1 CPBP family intramembrane metalloprotease [Bryobacteraceae bacterium]HPQ14822.1 CPBP family intramembrane metalloprotease [Bryobacteraceae bacterium]HPU71311.1 CPBP family intramembrane metalloprotease [Bryobacteraceae bacterium]
MTTRLPDKALATILRVGVFVILAIAGLYVFGWALFPFGYLVASALSVFAAAAAANALAMRIYEQASLVETGLHWTPASARNLLVGLGSGIAAAVLILAGPLVAGAAELVKAPGAEAQASSILMLLVILIFGGIGEELLFHGYGFQVLLGAVGPVAAILPVSVLFALAHSGNLNVSTLGLINTGLWGVVLGYAFWRSGDLWLPIGLHVGWNWMLPLFGTNLSGFTMNVTGYVMRWHAGPLWSGGDYGPEGGLLTSAVVVVLFVWLAFKAPVRRQRPFLLRERRQAE